MYGPVLEKFRGNKEIDPTGLLLFVLASVIYHSPWLCGIVTEKPGHPFALIPLLNKPELLCRLRAMVSLEQGGQVSRVTGIPPHIENAIMCSKLLRLCDETLKEVKSLTITVKDAVASAYEEKAIENGQLTGERLRTMFEDYHGEVIKAIDERIKIISQNVINVEQQQDSNLDDDGAQFADGVTEDVDETPERQVQHRLYTYEGKMWHVPRNFLLPMDANLFTGWQLWIGGQPGYIIKNVVQGNEYAPQLAPVRPFRLLTRKFLPPAVRKIYSLSWDPIFRLMGKAPGINFNDDAHSSFKVGYEYLKEQVQYIFNSTKMKIDTWCVSYWSVKVQRSSILKNGTEEDKMKLPEAHKRNRRRRQHTKVHDDGREVKRRHK